MNDRPSRVVLISGATRGTGLAVAKECLDHGGSLSLGARWSYCRTTLPWPNCW
ncbi:hypothetical protein PQR05_22245 [Paraburkholderia sediminicola]|uniref:SDR family NAD(P)-dependent oxidoreductase n=1 Tax=Paraburkholderia metrosideri TaxID=580937 RepID=A0ABW9DWQ0_9BURK